MVPKVEGSNPPVHPGQHREVAQLVSVLRSGRRGRRFESGLPYSDTNTKQGGMAEWSNAAVLKTVDLRGSGGSNPSLSAKQKENGAKHA